MCVCVCVCAISLPSRFSCIMCIFLPQDIPFCAQLCPCVCVCVRVCFHLCVCVCVCQVVPIIQERIARYQSAGNSELRFNLLAGQIVPQREGGRERKRRFKAREIHLSALNLSVPLCVPVRATDRIPVPLLPNPSSTAFLNLSQQA